MPLSQYLEQCLWLFSSGHFEQAKKMCINVKEQNLPVSIETEYFALLFDLIAFRTAEIQNIDVSLISKLEYLKNKSIVFGLTPIRSLRIEMALNCSFGCIKGVPISVCPLLIQNNGVISFGQSCQFGYHLSAYFFSSYVHLNVRGGGVL